MSLFQCPKCKKPFKECICLKKKEKPKVKCDYCGREFVNIEKHLSRCPELVKPIKKTDAFKDFQIQIEKQINDLKNENIKLRKMTDLKNKLFEFFSKYNFDRFEEEFKKKYDLKKFDKIATIYGKKNNMFHSLKYLLDNNPDIRQNKDRHRACQIINRWERGDRKYYRSVFNLLIKEIVKIME